MLSDSALGRRTFFQRGLLYGAGVALAPISAFGAASHPAEPAISSEVAMARLAAGNARFVAGRGTHPNLDVARRMSLAGGQHPFATILACADSRVAPELIFDQGLGDLFVVRVAGNVIDDPILASIEYAVIHLRTNLVMVLGHEHCGAVTATVEALAGRGSDDDKGTKIGALAALIAPAVKAVPASAPNKVEAAVSINAENSAAELTARSGPLKTRVQAGTLKIVAARYSLGGGQVIYLPDGSAKAPSRKS